MLDGLPSIYKALGLIPQCCKTNQLTRIKLLLFKLISYTPSIFQTHSDFSPHKSIFFLGRHDGTCLHAVQALRSLGQSQIQGQPDLI